MRTIKFREKPMGMVSGIMVVWSIPMKLMPQYIIKSGVAWLRQWTGFLSTKKPSDNSQDYMIVMAKKSMKAIYYDSEILNVACVK